jgi:hypothetical protein
MVLADFRDDQEIGRRPGIVGIVAERIADRLAPLPAAG